MSTTTNCHSYFWGGENVHSCLSHWWVTCLDLTAWLLTTHLVETHYFLFTSGLCSLQWWPSSCGAHAPYPQPWFLGPQGLALGSTAYTSLSTSLQDSSVTSNFWHIHLHSPSQQMDHGLPDAAEWLQIKSSGIWKPEIFILEGMWYGSLGLSDITGWIIWTNFWKFGQRNLCQNCG